MEEVYCTLCGHRLKYMGIRDTRWKRRKFYDRDTGKPMREQWWECPNSRRWFSPGHDRLVRDYAPTTKDV